MNGTGANGSSANGSAVDVVPELLRQAIEAYADDPDARRALEGYQRRLAEPLRVALAGMVKAGKSTLLNAIIGEEIAPTDTAECTRVVTWYRYRDTPRITLYPAPGGPGGLASEPRTLPIRRVKGRLVFDMGTFRAEEVDRLVVDWPAKGLRELTLIDTPGIASLSSELSARSTDFLTPRDAPSEADAVVYLMRHLHAADLRFLEAFKDTSVGQSGTVNALAVLSRADEIGAGRIDSLLSAGEIAERYRRDGTLRSLALGVVPIAGLLAQSARTLRQAEFTALLELARLDRSERERMLLSADRFARPTEGLEAGPEIRAALLERFGLFGIRMSTALIRGGIAEPTALAHELARRSGLDELLHLMSGQFQARAAQLKARTALAGVEALLRERPRAGTERVAALLERIQAGAHEFRELRLLATARTTGLDLPKELASEAERLIGGRGILPALRLGLPDGTSSEALRAEALACLRRWRTLAENPMTDRSAAESCQIVVRSCEAVLARLPDGSAPRPTVRLVLGSEPGVGAGQQTDQQRRTG
ncbi:dynamin family protein [Arthrobacter sp. VKM Ac-2550]|uniref:dynamin family protein n=1 Tax=Crystallibacter permensis TaxID=1938888 RepID=UPI00222717A4|nr:dynamin family protein [Arthrobacter sp. VKM Ac-2550]MCW2134680.1 50S ribosome-binding GTPase [Arthrobacter sp. VKM Ac-2550]